MKDLRMPILTIKNSGKTHEVAPGTLLIDAILAAGEEVELKCNREAKCDSCHLFVHEGKKSLTKTTPAENARLDSMIGVGSKSRLACQCSVGTENITVELLGALSG
jgi:2Fe-2S ferredoxin